MYFPIFLKIIFSVILSAVALLPSYVGIIPHIGAPTVMFDAEKLTGKVTSGASGYLYGIAEDGVPSHNMVESLDISSVSAKTQEGLQHPIGEVGDVATSLLNAGHTDYIVVYLQDMFSTWYYDEMNINETKKNGTYNWKEYLTDTYFPLIEKSINAIKNEPYADKLVYCIFNECDNGVWFGEWITDGENGWNSFNEIGKSNFNEAWKMTYDYVKSLVPDAKIGGPGNYEYNADKTDDFLSFASKNNCVPEIIIYHELGDRSVYDWEANVECLKRIEEKYGIDTSTPIIITEYGRMQDNSNPNTMLKYIICSENTKVYSNQAYWLLANNLCSTAADYNTPNSAWWVYRWYANLQGQTMQSKISDILHSDLGKALKNKREPRYQQFMALGTLSDKKDKLEVLVSGADYDGRIKIKNLKGTDLYGKNVKIEISAVTYQGISGKVYEPETVKIYTQKCRSYLSIPLEMNTNTAYKITVTECSEQINFENDNLFARYEFEHGTLLGNAYTYDSAYATTGEINGMVGGIEKAGDGVRLNFDVPADGEYLIRLIYGKANDGKASSDRVHADFNFSIDGEKEILSAENTIRSEITSTIDLKKTLNKGTHIIEITNVDGTVVFDSMLIKKAEEKAEIYCEKDDDREFSYLAVSPYDGYFEINACKNALISVDGAKAKTDENGNATVYLRRGLNYIDFKENTELKISKTENEHKSIELLPKNAELVLPAKAEKNEYNNFDFITGISSDGGSANFKVNADKSGTYKMTILYSNNRENGVHAYNVDLVEDFVTISVNGKKQQNLYCRNTYSKNTYTTVTTNVELEKGENILTISNDGANKFNSNTTFAPDIAKITINSTEVKNK